MFQIVWFAIVRYSRLYCDWTIFLKYLNVTSLLLMHSISFRLYHIIKIIWWKNISSSLESDGNSGRGAKEQSHLLWSINPETAFASAKTAVFLIQLLMLACLFLSCGWWGICLLLPCYWRESHSHNQHRWCYYDYCHSYCYVVHALYSLTLLSMYIRDMVIVTLFIFV